MTRINLFDVAIARLRLPVPMAKLQVIHGVAHALANEPTAHQTWQALLRWIRALKLESEVLEALSIAVLARGSPTLNEADLRSAVNAPSILSDVFISTALDTILSVNSWSAAHSGEAPFLYRNSTLTRELIDGTKVPLILKNRFERLERFSGKPFLSQWTYEFERLLSKNADGYDGHFSYFSDGPQKNEGGSFVARSGHCARSAYLRTLAFSCEQWEVPVSVAKTEAMFASPTDLSLLPMLPGEIPKWAPALHRSKPTNTRDAETLVAALVSDVRSSERKNLLHLNLPLHHDELYRAEIEVIACLVSDVSVNPEEVFDLHHRLPGKAGINRTGKLLLCVDRLDSSAVFDVRSGGKFRPALLPIVSNSVAGYLQSDLIGRMPYVPSNSSSIVPLMALPRNGGADLRMSGEHVGNFCYWNWMWRPMHASGLGCHGGVAVMLKDESLSVLYAAEGMHLCRALRLCVQTRQKNHAEWDDQVFFAMTPLTSTE